MIRSNAPGQLLGFSFQYPRALYHLLKSGPGDSVCVEHLGDVATQKSNSEVIAEEDKSSIVGNPLTDRSTDLWKTFSNWINAINDADLVVEKTWFLLHTNQKGRIAIIDKFSSAKTAQEIQEAIDHAKEELSDIGDDHAIWPYYDNVINQNESLLAVVLERFEFHVCDGAGYDEVRDELIRIHCPKYHIEHLLENIGGWLIINFSEKIAARQVASVSWEDFHEKFTVLFERARRLELIDFTLKNPPEDLDIQQQVKIRPCYLQQLEAIDIVGDEIITAVTDYLRAKVNHDKWIECGIIDEDVASEFESKLKAYWQNKKSSLEITEQNRHEHSRGQLLYFDCKSRQETIRGESPPSSTTVGTYHALADEPVIGWHPNWNNLFMKPTEE